MHTQKKRFILFMEESYTLLIKDLPYAYAEFSDLLLI